MGVFVLTDQHQLVPMKSAQFVTEDEFQSLLVNFPELLSGDTAERYIPRRWLLLNREQPVPAEDGGAGRWSIDHLFVDVDECVKLAAELYCRVTVMHWQETASHKGV